MQRTFSLLCRIFMGVIFLGAGFNGYLVIFGFSPIFPTSPKAMEFLQGYLLIMVKTIELICGISLLINVFVPLSLVILAPIVVNILAFHLFVDPDLLPLGALVFVLEVLLIWIYRKQYLGILKGSSPSPLHPD
ncbi:hypothetical protein NDK47_06195 [Brevibacillus ruminantium]|uniref:DoxX family protein n=1 Tax=Brevibacillus ruminantium TaxID=2950604 RepID=A0ABY4WJB8_9BACL|nr:hypothetical protein [Brevibacillus ruminantium]USG66886.1 hypothetical protein NDK47_06195 [Brevibacillus ruminantium]